MSLELLKEAVKVNQIIGEDSTQTIVENDIIVPDIKPDIARILLLDGDACIDSSEVMQDKVLINGTIRYKILYISDDNEQPLKSINTSSVFHYSIDIPNAKRGMNCKVKCDIEHMEYEVINSRKVNVKTIVNVGGKVVNSFEQTIPCDFEKTDRVQVLKTVTNVNVYIGSSEVDLPVKEIMEVPAGKPVIKELLRNDIKISGKDYKLTDDKVIVKGEVNVSTLYIGDDETGSVQYMEHEFPFTQFVDVPGVNEESFCEVDYNVIDSSFTAEEDNDGELRMLSSEVALKVFVDAYGKKEIEIIDDAYSPDLRMSLEKELLNMEELVSENKGQVVLKDSIYIEDNNPEIAEVFNILNKPLISNCIIEEDRIIIEGVLDSSILYLANNIEQPVFCCGKEIPFRHEISQKGINPDMGCDIDVNIEHSGYSIASAKEVEIRIVLNMTTRIVNQVTIPVISKVSEQSLDDKRSESQPSIVIYFAQQGDSLWKIAKKYYTTMDEIRKINDISGEIINQGDQIFIPKKINI